MNSRLPITIAVIHLLAVFVHDIAHVGLGIFDGPVHTTFVLVVIHAMPVAAIVLLVRGVSRSGLGLLASSLFGTLVFSTYKHFVAVSHDHVAQLPDAPLTPVFQATAIAISVVDAAGLIAVLAFARRALLPAGPRVLFIDGTCIMCHGIVSFILRHDREGAYYFAHLQSDYGKRVRARHGADVEDLDGIYLLIGEGSEAEQLVVDGGMGRVVWSSLFWWATPLLLMPVALLDPSYVLFAKIRYRLFGQFDRCHVPTGAERARFLTGAGQGA